MRKNIRKMHTFVAKNLITDAIYKCVLSLFVLARGTLKFLFRLKLDSQLLRGGKSSCSLWSELQVMESKSLVVIDCLRRESVSKLAWCNASLYGTWYIREFPRRIQCVAWRLTFVYTQAAIVNNTKRSSPREGKWSLKLVAIEIEPRPFFRSQSFRQSWKWKDARSETADISVKTLELFEMGWDQHCGV